MVEVNRGIFYDALQSHYIRFIGRLRRETMFKCYLTGVELNDEDAFILDVGAARRAIKKLKDKTFALEKLVVELGQIERVEIRTQKGKTIKQNRRRLICRNLAEAFSKTYLEDDIFIKWRDWIAKMKSRISAGDSSKPESGAAGQNTADT